MRITAYATVRDEVPGPWAEQLSSDDPWLAQYLHAVADSYLESSAPVMSLEVSHLIRHIRDTRRRYVFERDSIEGLQEWAVQANAVFEMPDRRVLNGAGEDIMAGGAVPFLPVAVERAARVRERVRKKTILRMPSGYAPVRTEHEVVVRESHEVARRMMALVVASELAAAMRARKPLPFEQLRSALPDGFASLSPLEAHFVELVQGGAVDLRTKFMKPRAVAKQNAATREAAEIANQLRFAAVAAQMLGHAVGWRPLPGDGLRVDPGKLIREVIEAGQQTVYERCRELIALPDLCEKHEFVRSMHWMARNGPSHPVRPVNMDELTAGSLAAWHRALAWLFSPGVEWEQADIST